MMLYTDSEVAKVLKAMSQAFISEEEKHAALVFFLPISQAAIKAAKDDGLSDLETYLQVRPALIEAMDSTGVSAWDSIEEYILGRFDLSYHDLDPPEVDEDEF